MKYSRIIIAAIFVIGFAAFANAQWTTNVNDIYNTNPGFVGIGTTSPAYLLDVSKNMTAPMINVKNTGGIGGAGFILSDQNSNSKWVFKTTSYASFKIRDQINGVNVIEVEKGSNAYSLYVKAGGNVGIGTSNPTYKLSVNGKIGCKEVEVTLSGWADYVFEDDYKLRTLSELETYIIENKHLPDVPSEKEVLENGVNIGEMNTILLKKIEELTLYMIELKKENEEIKSQIENLK